jgi:hypothetical protein
LAIGHIPFFGLKQVGASRSDAMMVATEFIPWTH